MGKDAKIILSVAVICVGLVVWRFNVQTATKPADDSVAEETTSAIAPSASPQDADTSAQVSDAPTRPKIPPQNKSVIEKAEKTFSFKVDKNLPQDKQELASLDRFAQALYLFSSTEQRPEFLVQKLNEAGLKPLVVQDFNDFTGKMIVVRTGETLPGTRYFHAQYFEDEDKKPFLQHMSFEYRPDEKSLDEAIDAVRKAFGKNVGPVQRCTKDFAAWEFGDMTAWCHQLGEEDIQSDDPSRARSKEDIGAVKCAIEQNPHPQDELCAK